MKKMMLIKRSITCQRIIMCTSWRNFRRFFVYYFFCVCFLIAWSARILTWQVFLPLHLVKRASSEIYLWPLLPQIAKDQAIHRTKVSQALRKEKAQLVKDHTTSSRFTNFCLCSTIVNS